MRNTCAKPPLITRSYEYAEDTAVLSDAGRHGSADAAGAAARAATGVASAPAAEAGLAAVAPVTGAGQSSGCPSSYDLTIIREVILVAEERARREYARGSGGREVTLLKLLQAYEQVSMLGGWMGRHSRWRACALGARRFSM